MGNYQSLVPLTHRNRYRSKKYAQSEDSVVLITGASSGLGKQLALVYARRKAKLLITGRNQQRLQETQSQCERQGAAEVHSFATDISKPENCKSLVEFCLNKFKRLDILVLNAGVNAHFKFDQLQDLDVVEDLMRTNYYANVYLTRYAIAHLKRSAGQIVVVSSMSGKVGTPSRSAYCASKFALGGFFEGLRTEDLGVDITVVYPPSLDTPMRSHDILALKHPNQSHPLKQQPREDPRRSAETIVMAADHRVENMYFPFKPYLAAYLAPFFPQTIRNKVKMAAKL